MNKTRNARFWAYVNGSAVKLTLRPGQTLRWYRGWTHEEGWSSELLEWEYDADDAEVVRQVVTDGRDCDGRLTRVQTDYCPVGQLTGGNYPSVTGLGLSAMEIAAWNEVVWPNWQEASRCQRDEFAEAAGY